MDFPKILRYASLYLKYAGFTSTKSIEQKAPKELFNTVLSGLDPFQKYFPIVWDKIEKSGLVTNPDELKIKEIIHDAKHTLKIFEGIRGNLQKKDFNDYSSLDELTGICNQYLYDVQAERGLRGNQSKLDKTTQEVEINPGDSTLIYEDPDVVVYRVNSKAGANALAGKDTSWCITRTQNTYYEQYTASNLTFYFCISKNLPANDKIQKVAIRVMKDYSGEIETIQYTNKLNDSDERNPEELPFWSSIKDSIIQDAEQQPEGLLSKVKNNRGTEEDAKLLWSSYFNSSIEEKENLVDIIGENPQTDSFIEMLSHKFSIDEVNKLNLKTLDAATLEKIAKDIYDEDLYAKLIKFNYPGVDIVVAKRTIDPKKLIQLSFSTFSEVQDKVARNPKTPSVVLYEFLNTGEINKLTGVASNQATPTEYLIQLTKNKNPSVRASAATNENIPQKYLIQLCSDEDWGVRASAATNENIPQKYLIQLGNDNDVGARLSMALNENTRPEVLTQLAKNPDVILPYLKHNPNTPTEVLAQL